MKNTEELPGLKNQVKNGAYIENVTKAKREPAKQKPQSPRDKRVKSISIILLDPAFIQGENFN